MKTIEETDERIVLEVIPGHVSSILTAERFVVEWFSVSFTYDFSEPAVVYSKKAREVSTFWLKNAYPDLTELVSKPPEGLDTLALSGQRLLDAPGCDFYPDYSCALGCCAAHDKCYADHGCSAKSWLCTIARPNLFCWLFANKNCQKCNRDVVKCLLFDCPEESCYDNCRDEFFDCPGKCSFWDFSDEKCCGCRDVPQPCPPTVRIYVVSSIVYILSIFNSYVTNICVLRNRPLLHPPRYVNDLFCTLYHI